MLETTNTTSEEKKRTDQQNRALHLWFQQLADELNGNGTTMTAVLQRFILEVPATKYSVKEMLWKPLQMELFGKNSTKELLKKEEIDKIYDALNKFFGEQMEMEIPPFPSIDEVIFKNNF